MFHIPHFELFALSVLLINITPGATFLAVTSEAITKGLRAGLLTAAGAFSGLLVYAFLSRLGLSAFIIHSKILFETIRYAGIIYLLYCAVKAFRQEPPNLINIKNQGIAESDKKGLFVNLLNPLTPVLFLTLIPQFINGVVDDASSQILFMGLWICFSALTVNIIFALLFALAGKHLVAKNAFWKWQGKITAVFFLLLAMKFAFFK